MMLVVMVVTGTCLSRGVIYPEMVQF